MTTASDEKVPFVLLVRSPGLLCSKEYVETLVLAFFYFVIICLILWNSIDGISKLWLCVVVKESA